MTFFTTLILFIHTFLYLIQYWIDFMFYQRYSSWLCCTYLILHPIQCLVIVTPWSYLMWSDSFVRVNYAQKSIHRLDVFLHALIPFPPFSNLPSQAMIVSSWPADTCTWSLTLLSSFSLSPYKAITLFWSWKQNKTCKTCFCPVSQQNPPSVIIFPEVVTAGFAICMGGSSDCGDICIAWDLQCLNPSEMCLGTLLSSIETHMNHICDWSGIC